MSTSRRLFLKSSAIAGAGVALGGLPALALPVNRLSYDTIANLDPKSTTSPGEITNRYTRGVGVYPGDPREDFSPNRVIDSLNYRNLALLRPAYHSSSYDYNLTAQLVTDGIKDTRLPDWVATSMNLRGVLAKHEREVVLDHNPTNYQELQGLHPSVQIQLGGGESVPEIDRIDLVVVAPADIPSAEFSFAVSVSEDGREWRRVGLVDAPIPAPDKDYPKGFVHPGQLFTPSISLNPPCRSRFYQVEYIIANATREGNTHWKAGEIAFFNHDWRVEIGGPYNFTSAWMSAGLGEEWIYVDLLAPCEFDRVALYWIARPAEAVVQVSDDAEIWRDLQQLSQDSGMIDDVKLSRSVRGRYVRVLMKRSVSPNGYMLSEIEVYGRGGPVARPKPAAPAGEDGRLNLAGGGWRLQRSSDDSSDGQTLSKTGFQDDTWVIATVPGTVLSSYLNVGAIPDPNFGRNQLYISDSFFYSDFWYRTEFIGPTIAPGQMAWLNFDGINWKAEVYLNGQKIGRVEGGFMRGRFDVTSLLHPNQKNALAVRIEKNATPGYTKQKTFESPGKNGGALGADNPTYHASVGWDWIPTIRGRNTGIVGDVSLTLSGGVTLEHPFVTTSLPLPDVSRADVRLEVDIVNHQPASVAGVLRGRFGDVRFEQQVTIEGSTSKRVKLDPSTHPALRLQSPKLWWPAGFGDPHLYDVELAFEPEGGKTPATRSLRVGVRQMAYSEDGGVLKIWINGRRVVARGGNWGFSESMLRYRAREYDAAVRYHREMNFNMIRNWVGQVGDDAFYEACDRYGVMIWQDFWLANPSDGPVPNDDDLFMSNVKDTLLRIRNHASVGLYCGRNEGFPPQHLEDGLRKTLADLHPGIHYIPSSADEVVGGGGPYRAMPLDYYPRMSTYPKLHSEIGMMNIPSMESVRAMMPESALWPQGLDWGLHDFCLQGAQGGSGFRAIIEDGYGGANHVEDWISLAQFVNYDGYRAMFEAQSKYRMGLLLWMSHPCWPSFVWQTYDYYFEPSAAYFACKKASEPLHIQWNRLTNSVEVVNYSAGNVRGLSAMIEVLNMNGSVKWKKSANLDSDEDSVVDCIQVEYPTDLSPVHFIRLTLARAGDPISTNFYMRGQQEGNYTAIRQLPKAKVAAATHAERQGDTWQLTTRLHNLSPYPALMVRLKAVQEKSGERILPAIYDDNYVALMPGERRTIQTELNHADTRGEKPRIVIGGFNVEPGAA